jgi:hypothetical protein
MRMTMNKLDEPHRLRQFLDALGNTRYEVAAILTQLSIKGKLDDASHCPIANYLRFKGYAWPIALSNRIVVEIGDGESGYIVPSAPIQDFILAFDRMEFPELIEDYGRDWY